MVGQSSGTCDMSQKIAGREGGGTSARAEVGAGYLSKLDSCPSPPKKNNMPNVASKGERNLESIEAKVSA
ncbi:hypothetical protein AB205_0121070 [Aquarana catesbeiana]|uniref:Uncharacterized protein n=1 Tax=Aquarana catesbeiana TaxID=8400 RepID=A0A2G9P7U6_AQUCT|nr:hypothetical protein AB205_0121070 [Aquarana catesbeiana]